MSKLDILGISKLALANEQPKDGFIIDSDVLRNEPDVVLRKHFYKSVNDLNTTADYNNYGVVVFVIDTTEPQLPVNRIKKIVSGDDASTFTEYLVMPVDKSHASIQTYLDTPEDILKSTTLIRCSTDLEGKKLTQGTFVKIQYDNNSKENATIVQNYGTQPPPGTDNGAAAGNDPASQAFNSNQCTGEANCSSTSDAAGYSDPASPPVSSPASSAPEPQFSTPACSVTTAQSISTAATAAHDIPDGYISKYFKLRDLTTTSHGPNIPNEIEKERIAYIANELLDKLVDIYGKGSFVVNSCFRDEDVNKKVGGVPNNQHRAGTAADISFFRLGSNENVLQRAKDIINNPNLIIDQFIMESNGPGSGWFHISVPHPGTIWKVARCRLNLPKGRMMYGPYTMVGKEKKYITFDENRFLRYIAVNDYRIGMVV